MPQPDCPADKENAPSWTPEQDWEARAEARARRAELAHLIADGFPTGAHPDYLAILDADDPRILAADFPPLAPTLLRLVCGMAKRALTAFTRGRPIVAPNVASESDAGHAGSDRADPVCRAHA